jgi:Predicted AAA-ATPase
MNALEKRKNLSNSEQDITLLAVLLKTEFFSIMKQACSSKSVAKYWLTGVLPAFRDGISPLTAVKDISLNQRYHSLCGFTQEDVDAIVKLALPKDKQAGNLRSLKHRYNGYRFSPALSGFKNPTLYNPQLVFAHLVNAISDLAPESYHAVHTSTVLSLVGKTGPVTISNLMNMFIEDAKAQVLKEFSFTELVEDLETRPQNVTWSLLYYLGIVTFSETSGYLRVPNATMNQLVSPGSRLGGC